MEKRKVLFGNYDTTLDGAWTVAGLELTTPDFQTNLVDVPGRDSPLDLSAALTGEPRYCRRNLTVVLENSDGDRLAREARIRKIINRLDGYWLDIVLPDDTDHYLQGQVHVVKNYNDLAHAQVTVTAVCDPWMYSLVETVYTLDGTAEAQTATIVNNGRRTVVPVVEVTGAVISLTYGTTSWELGAGTYQLPDFFLTPGEHEVTYSGDGVATITYREAVLL